MIKLKKWHLPVLGLGFFGILAGLFQFNVVRLDFEAESVLAYKGELKKLPAPKGVRVERGAAAGTIRLIGQGATPSGARRTADSASAALVINSLDLKKNEIRQKAALLKKRQDALNTRLSALNQDRQTLSKGSRRAWTPEMARRLSEATQRRRSLMAGWPSHTDIPVLNQEIKSLEAAQRGQSKIDPARVAQVSKQVTEARVELSFVTRKKLALEQAEKKLLSDWKLVSAAAQPRWPVRAPGWPAAAGTMLTVFIAGFLLLRQKAPKIAPANGMVRPVKIPMELATEEAGALPDDPQSRKAAALYERWLELVKVVYAINTEPPKDIYEGAEPLFNETAAFLAEGQDTLTRYLARVVVPGDLFSHVARTVLMALMGAYEAGASAAQQQGMTYAALFHDLAVAPRPAHAWDAIGSEVGRLSSGLLRRIPGIPEPLLAMVQDILVAMDEFPMPTWQNVTRSEDVQSFAKLLGHIDRFDKVMQKQQSRITRRMLPAA